jgi:hypothetical protein
VHCGQHSAGAGRLPSPESPLAWCTPGPGRFKSCCIRYRHTEYTTSLDTKPYTCTGKRPLVLLPPTCCCLACTSGTHSPCYCRAHTACCDGTMVTIGADGSSPCSELAHQSERSACPAIASLRDCCDCRCPCCPAAHKSGPSQPAAEGNQWLNAFPSRLCTLSHPVLHCSWQMPSWCGSRRHQSHMGSWLARPQQVWPVPPAAACPPPSRPAAENCLTNPEPCDCCCC